MMFRNAVYTALLFIEIGCNAQNIVRPGRATLHTNAITTFDFSNFVDGSGNGNDLTMGGSEPATIVTNVFLGQPAIKLSGNTVLTAEPEKYLLTTNYTIEGRFKRDINHLGTRQVLFGVWRLVYRCEFDTANKLTYQHGTTILQTAAITDSNTHSFAVAKSGSTLYLFLDGTLVTSGAAGAPFTPETGTWFRVGDDDNYAEDATQLYCTIGDFRFSNIARYTATYTPSASYLTTDANTVSLLPFTTISGNYLTTPVYQGNILLRTGYPQASGGWANPDGFLLSPDGSYFFSVSGFDGTQWKVYAGTSSTPLGTYTMKPTAIQTPSGGEGTLAGNGTVIYFHGQCHHFYHDDNLDVKHSIGDSLNQAFPTGTTIFTHGVGGYTGYADPFVRLESGTLVMYMMGNNASLNRFILTTTSTDGITWTTPVDHGIATQRGYGAYTGEAAAVNFGGKYIINGDAATASSGVGRNVIRWISKDGTRYMPLGKLISPAGGSYIAVYDGSPYYDEANRRLVYICTNSTNTQPTQPTDSDIGIWYSDIR